MPFIPSHKYDATHMLDLSPAIDPKGDAIDLNSKLYSP